MTETYFGWGEEAKALAGAVVEFGGDGVQVVFPAGHRDGVTDSPHVRLPGKIAADEAIGALDRAFLPGVI
jgi:hypothetical protein